MIPFHYVGVGIVLSPKDPVAPAQCHIFLSKLSLIATFTCVGLGYIIYIQYCLYATDYLSFAVQYYIVQYVQCSIGHGVPTY
jgi:hypothetical protein